MKQTGNFSLVLSVDPKGRIYVPIYCINAALTISSDKYVSMKFWKIQRSCISIDVYLVRKKFKRIENNPVFLFFLSISINSPSLHFLINILWTPFILLFLFLHNFTLIFSFQIINNCRKTTLPRHEMKNVCNSAVKRNKLNIMRLIKII